MPGLSSVTYRKPAEAADSIGSAMARTFAGIQCTAHAGGTRCAGPAGMDRPHDGNDDPMDVDRDVDDTVHHHQTHATTGGAAAAGALTGAGIGPVAGPLVAPVSSVGAPLVRAA